MSRRSLRSGKTTPGSRLDYKSIAGKDWLSVGDSIESRLQQTLQQETCTEIEQYLVSPLSSDIPSAGTPIKSAVYLVSCVHCNKVILASSFASHLENCPKGPKSGQSAQTQELRRLLGKRSMKPESFYDDPVAKRRRLGIADGGSDSLYVDGGDDGLEGLAISGIPSNKARSSSGRFKKRDPIPLGKSAGALLAEDAEYGRGRAAGEMGGAEVEMGTYQRTGGHAAKPYALAGTPYRTRNKFYAIAACFIDVVP